MIKVNGQLCYSPHPPGRYATKPVPGRNAYGFGAVCGDDVQLWNLVYLSCVGIDDHLDPPSDAHVHDLVSRDITAYAMAAAALTGPHCRELFPALRNALKQHPTVFLQELWKMPYWWNLPQMQQIPDWDKVIIAKVDEIEQQARSQIQSLITGRAGNVINVTFPSSDSFSG